MTWAMGSDMCKVTPKQLHHSVVGNKSLTLLKMKKATVIRRLTKAAGLTSKPATRQEPTAISTQGSHCS